VDKGGPGRSSDRQIRLSVGRDPGVDCASSPERYSIRTYHRNREQGIPASHQVGRKSFSPTRGNQSAVRLTFTYPKSEHEYPVSGYQHGDLTLALDSAEYCVSLLADRY
jgi:hypothetical protein